MLLIIVIYTQEKSDEKFENGPVTPHATVVNTETESTAEGEKREKRDTSQEIHPPGLTKDSPKNDESSSEHTPSSSSLTQPKPLSNPVRSGSGVH